MQPDVSMVTSLTLSLPARQGRWPRALNSLVAEWVREALSALLLPQEKAVSPMRVFLWIGSCLLSICVSDMAWGSAWVLVLVLGLAHHHVVPVV